MPSVSAIQRAAHCIGPAWVVKRTRLFTWARPSFEGSLETFDVTSGSIPVKGARVPVGRVAAANGDAISDEVLRERAQLGRSGIVLVSVVLDRRGAVIGSPEIISRGVVDASFASALRQASAAAGRAITEADPRIRNLDESLRDAVRLATRRAIESHTGRRPLVMVTLTRT